MVHEWSELDIPAVTSLVDTHCTGLAGVCFCLYTHVQYVQCICMNNIIIKFESMLVCMCNLIFLSLFHLGKSEEETLEELSSRATSRMTSGTSHRSRAPTSMGMANNQENNTTLPTVIPGWVETMHIHYWFVELDTIHVQCICMYSCMQQWTAAVHCAYV